MSTPDTPQLPPEIAAAVQHAQMPDFPGWQEMVNATGGCAQPIRLKGERLTFDAETGELIESYSTNDEPTGYLLTACGNRRASRCPACAEVYRDDTYRLIISGLSGGKDVPETVSSHPRVFLTLTAPSFEAVHSRRERAGTTLPCRPRRDHPICPRSRPEACGLRHEPDAAILGQPICGDCYDYPAAVLWNAHAPECTGALTNVTMSALIRIAKHKGIEVCVPDLVIEESVNIRRTLAQEAADNITASLRKAAKLFDVDGVYIPNTQEIADAWESELRYTFEVVPITLDDAREALRREALRMPPARDGRGSRDSAIWLTSIRSLKDSQNIVYFVSSNTDDFSGASKTVLHESLLHEVEQTSGELRYLTSIPKLIEELATKFQYTTSDDSIRAAGSILCATLIDHDEFIECALNLGLSPEEIGRLELAHISSHRTLAAYSVNDSWLALLQIEITAQFREPHTPADSLNVDLRCWVELETPEGPIDAITVDSLISVDR